MSNRTPRTGMHKVSGQGLTLQQVADHNSRVTLEAIRREGPLTVKELASRNGLTSPGVGNIVRKLSAEGLVIAAKRRQKNGRSGASEYSLRAEGAFSVGMRVGRTHGEAVLVDLSGAVWDRAAFVPGENVEHEVCACLRAMVQSIPENSHFSGVGIGIEHDISISAEVVQGCLETAHVLIEDACSVAVLSERVLGVGAIEGGLMYILIGDTVRAGLLFRDKPYCGVHGRAGQIGKLRTGGDHTSLDDVAGVASLRAAIGDAEVARVAQGGDLVMTPELSAWLKSAVRHFLDAIVATAGFLAPGMVLIGGDLPRQINDLLVERILSLSAEYATRPFSSPWMPEIRSASFEQAGVAIGAALLPFFDTLLPPPFHSDPAPLV